MGVSHETAIDLVSARKGILQTGRESQWSFEVSDLLEPARVCTILCRHLQRSLRLYSNDPRVPLRSTRGRGPRPSISAGVLDFMLTPAPRVLES